MSHTHTEQVQIPAPVTVSIDVAALINSSDFLPGRYDDDAEGWEPGAPLLAMIAQILANKIGGDIRKEVRPAIEEQVREQVADIVREVIDGNIAMTNSFGESTGATMTMRERIIKEAKEVLVDRKVNPQNGSFERYPSNGSVPYITYLVRKEAKAAIDNELKGAIADAIAEVKKTVTTVVSEDLGAKVAAAVTRAR